MKSGARAELRRRQSQFGEWTGHPVDPCKIDVLSSSLRFSTKCGSLCNNHPALPQEPLARFKQRAR